MPKQKLPTYGGRFAPRPVSGRGAPQDKNTIDIHPTVMALDGHVRPGDEVPMGRQRGELIAELEAVVCDYDGLQAGSPQSLPQRSARASTEFP